MTSDLNASASATPSDPISAQRRVLVLDGGMGSELRRRGVPVDDGLWSSNALLVAPDTVLQVHLDDIKAGADVITANTYGITRRALAKAGMEGNFARLNNVAGMLAIEARDRAQWETGRRVLVAGSLPPLRGSFRPDLVGPFDEIYPLYREQAELLATHVDMFLCETMSSAAEGFAAASAAATTGKPIWVAWTLRDDRSGLLRSGESVSEAAAALAGLPVQGVLANCCPPESIDAAMPELARQGKKWFGGYANAYGPVPADWVMDGTKPTDGKLTLRTDLAPEAYATFARRWRDQGATIIGGCCGIGPDHIARIRRIVDGED